MMTDHSPSLADKPGNTTGRANQLAALAGVHFNVVNFQAAGDIRQRNAISQFRRGIGAA